MYYVNTVYISIVKEKDQNVTIITCLLILLSSVDSTQQIYVKITRKIIHIKSCKIGEYYETNTNTSICTDLNHVLCQER